MTRTRLLGQARAWIFDLDNTLLECLRYYEEARERVRALLAEAGIALSYEEFVAHLGVVRKPIFETMGFGHVSFAAALREACRVLINERGMRNPELLQQAWDLGEGVFHAPYTPYPGALRTLRWLRRQGHPLALLTKGEEDAQWRKIRMHGLHEVFDLVDIVRYKTEDDVRRVIRALGTSPDQTAMVGDSLFDDVRSGQRAGCMTVWVNEDPVYHPELHGHEQPPEPDAVIARVTELPTLLRAPRPVGLVRLA